MSQPIEHVFRHDYGKLVAALITRFGIQKIDAIEDAVQYSIEQALLHWVRAKQPKNPAGWLYKVALRQLVSELRVTKRRNQLLIEQSATPEAHVHKSDTTEDEPFAKARLTGELDDAFVRMLFAACDKGVPSESQLVFTLKSLCGFNTREIAQRLFISEANVYKRYNRARNHLQTHVHPMLELSESAMQQRVPAVCNVLYSLFTEGYFSSNSDAAIRQELCDEAIRLGVSLTQSHVGQLPQCYALVSLMLLNSARLNARSHGSELVLLEQQDRTRWDQEKIHLGLYFLQESAQGETITRYHLEAGIAAEHCLSPSFEQTRWDKIVASYEQLEQLTLSPLHQLSKAIALSHWKGPKQALEMLEKFDTPEWLLSSYHWFAVLADLQYQTKSIDNAKNNATKAIELAPSQHIKRLLKKRFNRY